VNRFDAATTKQTIKLKRTNDVLRNRTTPSATDMRQRATKAANPPYTALQHG
jgi:hypothetical protein